MSPDDKQIYVLEDDAPIGADLVDFLADDILDIELTPNRADCLGIVGIAREVSALTGSLLRMPNPPTPTGSRRVEDAAQVFVDAPDLCPRYTAAYIEGVTIGPSPQWMQRRLYLAGVRAISNVVDVTNYVMLELGQPLHAFDVDKVAQATIRVRRARAGERLTTIDGIDRELNPETLLIADAESPIGLAGIMGGLNSEISDSTNRIVLESANFNRLNIRRTSQALRLSTEASKRFDKGLDLELPPVGANRAMELMLQVAGGTTASGRIDVRTAAPERRRLTFSVGDVSGLIGQSYQPEEIEQILEPLGFAMERSDGQFAVTVPTWRGDVEGKADIAEEVARIRGYDAIPVRLPSGNLPRQADNPSLRWSEAIRTELASSGLQEVITYSLIDPFALARLRADAPYPASEPDADSIPVHNPMSSEQSRLRPTLLPSLINTIASNLRFQSRVAIFEMAHVFLPPLDPLPTECQRLTIALAGQRAPESWANDRGAYDFYDLKAAVEGAFAVIGRVPTFTPERGAWLHPGRSAVVRADSGEVIGRLGQVHPRVAERFDVEGVELYAAELDLDVLLALAREEITVRSLPRYPAVQRDLAGIVNDQHSHEEIEAAVRRAAGSLLDQVALFDVYRGSPVPEGHRSLAYSLTFRAPDRTLTEDEVGSAMRAVEQAIVTQFGGQIRGR